MAIVGFDSYMFDDLIYDIWGLVAIFMLTVRAKNRPVTTPDVRSLNLAPPHGQAWKPMRFQASFQGTQIHEKWSQEHLKNIKIESKIIRIPIYVKSRFLQYLPCENLVLGALGVQISSQKSIQNVTRKQAPR